MTTCLQIRSELYENVAMQCGISPYVFTTAVYLGK